jgi:uncharacterized SAM-binding protein YcdF (DUF218 family)
MEKIKNLILLLGAPNDELGQLSVMALNRNECAYNFYCHNEGTAILCTGGMGEHFNRTEKPHAAYAQAYLMERGVAEGDLFPCVLSTNTYEDFMLSKEIIKEISPDLFIVITSDFHMERAKLLQYKLIDYPNVLFIAAKSTVSHEELNLLSLHEQQAIRRILES